jgi:hypothetical protein
MYQELQRLKSRQRETHTLDAPSLDNVDPEIFMVSMDKSRANPDVALLDSATTHRILRDPKYFIFSSHEVDVWQECDVTGF